MRPAGGVAECKRIAAAEPSLYIACPLKTAQFTGFRGFFRAVIKRASDVQSRRFAPVCTLAFAERYAPAQGGEHGSQRR